MTDILLHLVEHVVEFSEVVIVEILSHERADEGAVDELADRGEELDSVGLCPEVEVRPRLVNHGFAREAERRGAVDAAVDAAAEDFQVGEVGWDDDFVQEQALLMLAVISGGVG